MYTVSIPQKKWKSNKKYSCRVYAIFSFKLDLNTKDISTDQTLYQLFPSLCVSTHGTVDQTDCHSTGWEVVVTCEMLNHFTVTALSCGSWQRATTSMVIVGGRQRSGCLCQPDCKSGMSRWSLLQREHIHSGKCVSQTVGVSQKDRVRENQYSPGSVSGLPG